MSAGGFNLVVGFAGCAPRQSIFDHLLSGGPHRVGGYRFLTEVKGVTLDMQLGKVFSHDGMVKCEGV
jgi:hypothetical protein